MKQQITRFSPHQNGKVFGVMMAVSSLGYLVFGYISVAIGCWVYNLLSQFTGGIEFESREDAA